MRASVLAPAVALQFLSVIPLRLPGSVPAAAFSHAVAWFPLVGAVLGVLIAALDALLGHLLPIAVVSALDLVVLAILTGGLHLDGLADATDGLLGNLEPERRLEVMRDGATGAFGAAALALALLVEYGALLSLTPAIRFPAIVVAVAASRWAMSLMLWVFPYARAVGTGTAFRVGLRWPHVAGAAVIALFVAAVGVSWAGLALVAISALVALVVGGFAVRRVGGCTGDVYGAGGELAFAATLVALSGIAR